MKKTLTFCYGALAFLATALAVVIALLILVALLLGGAAGSGGSACAGTVAKWSIYVAAVAVLVGFVHTYLDGSHSLTAGSPSSRRTTPRESPVDPDLSGRSRRS